MIEIKELTKIYSSKNGSVTALNNISLRLPNKGFVAIYGENGCGKTTLLNMIATVDTDYNGQITYNNTDYRNIGSELRHDVIAFVLQEKFFIPYLNLYENIELFADEEDVGRITGELDTFSLQEKSRENTENLSGGQRQRSSFIRGIIKKSRVLLVDEPTSSLNEEMEREVFVKLREYAKEKLVVLVSHNIGLIRTFADVIIHMDKGVIASVENNSKTDIEYLENEITVPFGFCDLSVIDKAYVRERLTNKKPVTINSRADSAEESLRMSYDVIDETEWKPAKHLPAKLKKMMTFAALGQIKKQLIFGICLVSLFTIMIHFLFSFAVFDEDKFIFENTVNNVDGMINFVYNTSIYAGKTSARMDTASFEEYRNIFSTPTIVLADNYQYSEFPFESSGMFYNDIMGISFCKENDVELLCGRFESSGELLITDYAADALISQLQEYTEYSSILEKGILINGLHFDVSGIINTDYEKNKNKYFLDSFIHSQPYIDFENSIQNEYCRIYYPMEQYLSGDKIYNVPLNYGEAFANICNIDKNSFLFQNSTITQNGAYINEALYYLIGNIDVIKFDFDFVDVLGVISDGDSHCNLYVTGEKLQTLKTNMFADITSILTKLSTVEQVTYLRSKNMLPETSVSGYIRGVINVVTETSQIFLFLTIFLVALLAGAVINLLGKLISSDNVAIALMRSSGYSSKSINKLEIGKTAILLGISVVLSNILFILCSLSLNLVLSKAFGYNITISLLDIRTIVATNLILLITFVIVTGIKIIQINRKKIIDLLRM